NPVDQFRSLQALLVRQRRFAPTVIGLPSEQVIEINSESLTTFIGINIGSYHERVGPDTSLFRPEQ
ncbi:MAG TPA: hypothetical protein VGZ29_11215, partial [Terriglobia bacterium]|nr:hypothetical protein [Terriglobia bacterium]